VTLAFDQDHEQDRNRDQEQDQEQQQEQEQEQDQDQQPTGSKVVENDTSGWSARPPSLSSASGDLSI